MSRKMLIDASHPEETRVVVVENNRVEDFDFESATKKQIRGNIYLAKVTRVEPSLQAAFVEYGGNKHGFLAFNEIHPDYYQIPFEDRQALREAEAKIERETDADFDDDDAENGDNGGGDDDDIAEEAARKRRNLLRKYKIQEVIKRRQVLLVQVAKEERGNKGAALTTYLSLAGRYCVLMPNTARGGGISRKITQASDRKRLKGAVQSLSVPKGMGLIIRTAGASRTKLEIKRDYDYLIRLWETIRELTLKSSAPTLIYEEGNLVKRAIRDLYDKDIEQVLVEGEDAYKEAKAFMRMLMPSHATKVQNYRDDTPLFLRHQVEAQLEAIYSPVAQLKSGGYLVINPTEALVSVDVNSGRSTKERNIEQTALRTNLEAAEEAARQMRLRDLAGLLVIDFIDMDENKNVKAVEKKMKDVLAKDRARIQTSRISQFGLMEISRQRRRTSLVEGSTEPCPHCGGTGYIRSVESSALAALRALEDEGLKGRSARVIAHLLPEVALYILNEKREHLKAVETRFEMKIVIAGDPDLVRGDCRIERVETRSEAERAALEASREQAAVLPETVTAIVEDVDDVAEDDDEDEAEAEDAAPSQGRDEDTSKSGRKRRRRRRSKGDRPDAETGESAAQKTDSDASGEDDEGSGEAESETRSEDHDEDGKTRKRRRRGRRGGRGRRRRSDETGEDGRNPADTGGDSDSEEDRPAAAAESADADVLKVVEPGEGDDLSSKDSPPKRERPARRRRKADDAQPAETAPDAPAEASESETADAPVEAEAPKPAPKRRRRKKAEPETDAETPAGTNEEAEAPKADDKPKRPSRSRAKPKAAAKPPAESEPAESAPAAESQEKPEEAPAPQSAPKPESASEPDESDADKSAKPKRGWWQRSAKTLFGGE